MSPPDVNHAWILTQSGQEFPVLRPDPRLLRIEDIALGLSNACRFVGQCRPRYSVAQHSVLMSRLVERDSGMPALAFAALMHDASEAYLTDLPRPLKMVSTLGRIYRRIEDGIMAAIALRFPAFGLHPLHEVLRFWDDVMLASEAPLLLPHYKAERWELLRVKQPHPWVTASLEGGIWSQEEAEDQFMRRFHFLDDGASDEAWRNLDQDAISDLFVVTYEFKEGDTQ